MRVVLVANDWTTLAYTRGELLLFLKDAGCDVTCVIPDVAAALAGSDHFRDVKMFEWKVSRHGMSVGREIFAVISLGRTLRSLEPNTVLSFTVKPNLYSALLGLIMGYRHIPNVTGLGADVSSRTLLGRVLLSLQKVLYFRSGRVFVQNTHAYDMFQTAPWLRSRLQLLPGSGVNLDRFSVQDPEWPSQQLNLLMVGRVRRDKGIFDAIAAAQIAKQRGIDVRLHIAGKIDEPGISGDLLVAESSGLVKYYGILDQSEIVSLMKECHALLHASHHEGMANVVLEAAACGRMALASNIPGCREIVHDGVTGFLFSPNDPVSVAAATERLASLSDSEIVGAGLKARQNVEMRFDRRRVIAAYWEAISE